MNINVSDTKLSDTNANLSAEQTKQASVAAPFRVERLGARLGAQIHDLDLKAGL